jgi:serine/threonine-protein phosphatase 2A regulatory subunit B''
LESANDINAISEYFSYEHFYVVYCKFWELDTDHDMLISRTDLSAHSSGGMCLCACTHALAHIAALTSAVINRIFSGCVQRHKEAASTIAGMLTYTDFVYLLMADEDKANPAAIEYWFRILDVDGDGVLSFYELETFYMAVKQKLLDMSVDPMSFTDVLCQMLDVINYRSGTGHGRDVEGVRLADLKRAGRMAATFLNAFINVVKYYDQEVESGNSERNATLEVRVCACSLARARALT